MPKRRKRQTPIALLWTRRDQLRFTESVERLCGLINDLAVIAGELRAEHATRKRPRRKQAELPNGAELP